MGGVVAPQGKVGCDYAWYWNCIALRYWKVKAHTVKMRLYRPGCQTVEVAAWAVPREVQWRGVADLAESERAVDDLVSIGTTDRTSEVLEQAIEGALDFHCLAPGSESPEHRKALLFAASEYERLAKSAKDDAASQAIRDRMLKKAALLRERAEK